MRKLRRDDRSIRSLQCASACADKEKIGAPDSSAQPPKPGASRANAELMPKIAILVVVGSSPISHPNDSTSQPAAVVTRRRQQPTGFPRWESSALRRLLPSR
jgi:hypothetical protein